MQNQNQNEIAHFTMPKVGEQESDIEDAYSWSNDRSVVAIADGTSTSFLAGKWAELLVEHFCLPNESSIDEISRRWEEWLRPVQQKWRQHYLKIKTDKTIPWNAKGGDKDHGSATFVGLKLQPPSQAGEKTWEALAVGDSCLFQIKANSDKLIAFPLDKSEQFTTVTNCFHSLPEYKSCPPASMTGLYEEGDIFFLASDALAEWIIKDYENHTSTWIKLISIATQEEFTNFINRLRHDRLIKNDDTTLLRINVVIPEGEKPKSPEQNQSDENNRNCQQTLQNKRNLYNYLVTYPGRIVLVLALVCVFMIAISNHKKLYIKDSHAQDFPDNKVLPPVDSKATDSKIPDIQVPIYSVEKNNKARPIGYLFKKIPGASMPLDLWVLVDSSYRSKTQKNTIIIPSNAISQLFPYQSIETLTPKHFLGVLLPGTYFFTEPKDSATFNNNGNWVKIQVRLIKEEK